IVFGLLAEALMAGATTVALSARGIDNQLSGGGYLQLLAGGTAAGGLWGTIGAGLGGLVPHPGAPPAGPCARVLRGGKLPPPFRPGRGRLPPRRGRPGAGGNPARQPPPPRPRRARARSLRCRGRHSRLARDPPPRRRMSGHDDTTLGSARADPRAELAGRKQT